MKKNLGVILLIVCMAVLIIGIIYANNAKKTKEQNGNFKIVTTFYPIYIITENITDGAQNINLVNMTDTNVGCLHDYTLSTADMRKLENANVIIQNGLGLENFIDKILNTYSNIAIINSSENISNVIKENEENNGHIWTSITNYMTQVEKIASELSRLNPENSEIYNRNKDNYIANLKLLQKKYTEELEILKNKKAICLNEAITYLAKEVNLDVTCVETDHEESSISAEHMKELIDKMKKENITAILVGNEDNLKSAQTLADETGAKIYKLKTGLTGNMDKNSYIDDMMQNLEQLKNMK